jgi:exopolysaccharide biosynthesis polyprenyl glycosylphosphotransferase
MPARQPDAARLSARGSPLVLRRAISDGVATRSLASAEVSEHLPALAAGAAIPAVRSRARRDWLVRRLLLAADLLALLVAFGLTEALFIGDNPSIDHLGILTEAIVFVATLPLWVVGAKVYGLYDRDARNPDHSTVDEIPSIFHFVTVVVWLFFAFSWITGLTNPSQLKLGTFWALAIGAVIGLRATARSVARRQPAYVQNAIIIGAGDVGQLMARKLLNHSEYGINLVGFIDAQPKERREGLGDLTILGSLGDVPELVRRFDIERVVIAFSNESHEATLELIRSLKDLDVHIDIVPRLFEIVGPRLSINAVEGVPLVSIPPLRLPRSSRFVKRALDLSLSLAGLVLVAPFFALIALLIKLDSRGPVLFTQTRMGSRDRTFRMYKFRTMVESADVEKSALKHLNKHANGDARMFKVPRDPRVTRVGRFLRRFSLDELPQLVNVVKGEMSLVGPRPLVLDEDEFVSTWARRRLALRPGMTGLWQVLGRTDIPFDEMVKLDYLYVTNWTLAGDLKILARTIPAVVRPQDAY